MRILFYSPFNNRSRDTESLMLAFKKSGHHVLSLSQQEGFLINDFLNENGIEASSYVLKGPRSGRLYYIRHIVYLIKFCWRNKVDVLYSHLESANFVSVIAQYFIRARVFLCRHHIDEGMLYGFDRNLYYKITYRLAKRIIVVSDHAKRYMIEKEGIDGQKIIHINLAYDFSLYNMPSLESIQSIRSKYPCEVLIVTVCRLTKYKRPALAIETVKSLLERGVNAKLILLGKGEMQEALEKLVNDLNLRDHVFILGHVSNVLEFIGAADFFLHPSVLDSSCVAVKEAGLVATPVIVCESIGDFQDYIQSGKNGFLVNKDHFVSEASTIILQHIGDKEYLTKIGEHLNRDVISLFSIERNAPFYEPLNKLS